MDFSKGKEYCEALCNGADENDLAAKEGLSIQDLYHVVDYTDGSVARKHLKHFCVGFANSICFCWPLCDEKLCPVNGYEIDCPLQKEK